MVSRSPIILSVCFSRSSFSSTIAFVNVATGSSKHMHITSPRRKPTWMYMHMYMYMHMHIYAYVYAHHQPKEEAYRLIEDVLRVGSRWEWHPDGRGEGDARFNGRWMRLVDSSIGRREGGECIVVDQSLESDETGEVVALIAAVKPPDTQEVAYEIRVGHGGVVEPDRVPKCRWGHHEATSGGGG